MRGRSRGGSRFDRPYGAAGILGDVPRASSATADSGQGYLRPIPTGLGRCSWPPRSPKARRRGHLLSLVDRNSKDQGHPPAMLSMCEKSTSFSLSAHPVRFTTIRMLLRL
jgi:hypothetical protein